MTGHPPAGRAQQPRVEEAGLVLARQSQGGRGPSKGQEHGDGSEKPEREHNCRREMYAVRHDGAVDPKAKTGDRGQEKVKPLDNLSFSRMHQKRKKSQQRTKVGAHTVDACMAHSTLRHMPS